MQLSIQQLKKNYHNFLKIKSIVNDRLISSICRLNDVKITVKSHYILLEMPIVSPLRYTSLSLKITIKELPVSKRRCKINPSKLLLDVQFELQPHREWTVAGMNRYR